MKKTVKIKGYRIGEGRPIVCIPIVAAQSEEILAQAARLGKERVPMIEWRIDWYSQLTRSEKVLQLLDQLQKVLPATILLVTYRSKAQGGEGTLQEKDVLALLQIIADSGQADLLDVEYYALKESSRVIRSIQQTGTKVIASHHNFAMTPSEDEMLDLLKGMRDGGADIVKLAVMPREITDVTRLLDVTAQFAGSYPETPLVTMSMGSMGVVSRISGESFGSCLTFGADGMASAPGQMNYKVLSGLLSELHQSITGGMGNIYLIGFMGTGKSTTAEALRQLTGMEIIDTDAELVSRAGKTISAIFETQGEGVFRQMEHDLMEELAGRKNHIISCGGGVILREDNRKLMKDSGTVVLLTATPETVLERVKNDHNRPLLENKKNVEDIRELIDARMVNYEKAMDVAVATDDRDVMDIASEIVEKVKERN